MKVMKPISSITQTEGVTKYSNGYDTISVALSVDGKCQGGYNAYCITMPDGSEKQAVFTEAELYEFVEQQLNLPA